MTIGKILSYVSRAASMLILAACAQTLSHGHLKEDEALAGLHVGSSTKDDAYRLLGSPSSQSTFGPPTWYYVSSKQEVHSLLATKLVDQHVTEVAFDTGGVVTAIKEYTLADGKNVEIATRTTPSEGQQLGFFEQILSNLGRFNNNKNGNSSISNNHGSGLPPVVR